MKFESFAGIQILEWFFGNPSKKIHFKELCRETKLGPVTIKDYCEQFLEKEWLIEKREANLRIFNLNNQNYVVQAMKKAWFLKKLHEYEIGSIVDKGIISLVLYGSHASGEYNEKSDVDILVIGNKEQIDWKNIKRLESKLGKEIQITTMSLGKWEKNKETTFVKSVLRNYVLLRGAAL